MKIINYDEKQTTIEAIQLICKNANQSTGTVPFDDLGDCFYYTVAVNKPEWNLAAEFLFIKYNGSITSDDTFQLYNGVAGQSTII